MDDRDIAKRAIDYQNRSREYRLVDLPGYMEWSKRKVAEGVSDALIAHLDATAAVLLPEELAEIDDGYFDEFLAELQSEFGE